MEKKSYFIFTMILLMLTCTVDASIDRSRFENQWWELQEYPVCFNFHENGNFLVYEDSISEEGIWMFSHPNHYLVGSEQIEVYEEGECWDIRGYKSLNLSACECNLIHFK